MPLFDKNILVYDANTDLSFYGHCMQPLGEAQRDRSPTFPT